MNTTKTSLTYKLGLPPEVMNAMKAHAERLRGSRKRSDLLFPSKRGGLMSRSALDKPFQAISEKIKLRFTLTPRGMRRTYQDVGRAAGIERNVRKAVCGHATDEMSDLYSTVRPDEMRAAVARITRAMTGSKAA
jgi:integrase